MAKFKKSTSNKQVNNPRKPKFTLKAHLYHRDVVAPLERKYRHAMKSKNYELARKIFEQIRDRKEEHRLLIHRKEKVRMN
ncbi:hypothetical protein [Hazenella coriacea]|uniref:Uncharacterized protein n=1 Tax=Hazenella coriacea TaxID=1179467 RepID=A0A4R3L1P0_9BACL|nr:hypothetical protein [Hazenella coriacea]TCS92405.1 hypothetical protein EDD58_11228 [Hazenella coriacea]